MDTSSSLHKENETIMPSCSPVSRGRLLLFLVYIACQPPEHVYAFRPPTISEELGCSPTLSSLFSGGRPVFFDPLKIANDSNFSRLREAELKHARVAMLAVIETVAIPILRRLEVESLPPCGLYKSFQQLETSDYFKVFITCGVLELFIFVQRDPKTLPGDYGVGYFGVCEKGIHERELVVELENGRLAMLALLIQVIGEISTGGLSWEDQWVLIVKRWASDL